MFLVITEKQKRSFITDAVNCTGNLVYNLTSSLPFEKRYNDDH